MTEKEQIICEPFFRYEDEETQLEIVIEKHPGFKYIYGHTLDKGENVEKYISLLEWAKIYILKVWDDNPEHLEDIQSEVTEDEDGIVITFSGFFGELVIKSEGNQYYTNGKDLTSVT